MLLGVGWLSFNGHCELVPFDLEEKHNKMAWMKPIHKKYKVNRSPKTHVMNTYNNQGITNILRK
jgi:hypothetical protein